MSEGVPDGERERPARVRVTAPRPGAGPGAGAASRPPGTRPGSRPGTRPGEREPSDVQGLYVRSLIRSQLRLALTVAAGFVVATVLFVVGIALLPELDRTFVAGVPVSWLLLGFGLYPLAITVGAVYVRAATCNEARYRALAEDPDS
ncbi:heavy metal transporter [Agromyces sp. NPDC058136]|uniref:heavy metal transporter n=1 Tax=Agromyces sp. NPDC058136 TaxID=3346354 RepID=UPI0036DC3FF6